MTNTAFAFGSDCHVEVVIYDHKRGRGAFVTYTRPIELRAGATRGKASQEIHKCFVAGFTLSVNAPDPPSLCFYDTLTQPEAFVLFLLHSRLSGRRTTHSNFDATRAEGKLQRWFFENVFTWATEDNVPGDSAFFQVFDVSTCTYKHPTTGETRSCFAQNQGGDITYTHFVTGKTREANGSGQDYERFQREESLMASVNREYRMLNCRHIRAWTCANGSKPTCLDSCRILFWDDAGKAYVDANDYKPAVQSLSDRVHAALDGASPEHVLSVRLAATPEDVLSLNMQPAPTEITVTAYYFRVAEFELAGLCTLWRNKVRPITPASMRTLVNSVSSTFDRRSLHGVHNFNDKRDLFVQFCALLGCDVRRVECGDALPRFYLTKAGVATFRERVDKDWHPSVFLHAFERMAHESKTPANTHRAELYMLRSLVVLQLGNMAPAFNKCSHTDYPARFAVVCEAVVTQHVRNFIVKAQLAQFKTTLAAALAECPVEAEAASSSAAPAALVPLPPIVKPEPGLEPSRKRAASAAELPPAPLAVRPKAAPNRCIPEQRKQAATKRIVAMCDELIACVQSHAARLRKSARGGEKHAACEKRIMRLNALKNEGANNNPALFVSVISSTFHTALNVERVAFANVFYAVADATSELALLDADTHNALHHMNPGDLAKFPRRSKIKPTLAETAEVFA